MFSSFLLTTFCGHDGVSFNLVIEEEDEGGKGKKRLSDARSLAAVLIGQ